MCLAPLLSCARISISVHSTTVSMATTKRAAPCAKHSPAVPLRASALPALNVCCRRRMQLKCQCGDKVALPAGDARPNVARRQLVSCETLGFSDSLHDLDELLFQARATHQRPINFRKRCKLGGVGCRHTTAILHTYGTRRLHSIELA